MLFCLLFVFLIFGRYYLDVAMFDNIQDLKEEDFEQQLVRNLGKCLWPYKTSFLSTYTHLHALNWYYSLLCIRYVMYG
jgi:hypothetical protein